MKREPPENYFILYLIGCHLIGIGAGAGVFLAAIVLALVFIALFIAAKF